MDTKKTCTKKKLDKTAASIAISNPNRGECRYYFCTQCEAYHLTSLPHNTFEKRLKNSRLELYLSRGEQKLLLKWLHHEHITLTRKDPLGSSGKSKVYNSLYKKLTALIC